MCTSLYVHIYIQRAETARSNYQKTYRPEEQNEYTSPRTPPMPTFPLRELPNLFSSEAVTPANFTMFPSRRMYGRPLSAESYSAPHGGYTRKCSRFNVY